MTVSRSTTHMASPVSDIQHHVVELGVVVGDALRDFSLRHGVQDDVHDPFVFQGELDFRLRILGAVVVVLVDGLLQGGEALPGVVEIRDGFVQPPARQVHQQMLELPKGAARLEGLLRRLHRLERLHSLHENERAPDFTVPVLIIRLARRASGSRSATAG